MNLSQLEIRRDLKIYEDKLRNPDLSEFMRKVYERIRLVCLEDLLKAQIEEFNCD